MTITTELLLLDICAQRTQRVFIIGGSNFTFSQFKTLGTTILSPARLKYWTEFNNCANPYKDFHVIFDSSRCTRRYFIAKNVKRVCSYSISCRFHDELSVLDKRTQFAFYENDK